MLISCILYIISYSVIDVSILYYVCLCHMYAYFSRMRLVKCKVALICTQLLSLTVLSAYSGTILSTGDALSLTQTLDGFSTNSHFGSSLSYSSTGTQFAVGAPNTNSYTGMYDMFDACI